MLLYILRIEKLRFQNLPKASQLLSMKSEFELGTLWSYALEPTDISYLPREFPIFIFIIPLLFLSSYSTPWKG